MSDAPTPPRMAQFACPYSFLGQLLQLPPGATIQRIDIQPQEHAKALITIEGAGWHTPEAALIMRAYPVVTEKRSKHGKLLRRTISYNFPK